MAPTGGACGPPSAGAAGVVCDGGLAGCDCAKSDSPATDIASTLAGTNHVGLDRELDFIGVTLLIWVSAKSKSGSDPQQAALIA